MVHAPHRRPAFPRQNFSWVIAKGKVFNNPRNSRFTPLDCELAKSSRSRKREILPTDQDDHQVRFYEVYRKVAEEYDKEFLKKYDEDLNTTLVFVSSAQGFSGRMFIVMAGRSLFRCRIRIYHSGRCSTST